MNRHIEAPARPGSRLKAKCGKATGSAHMYEEEIRVLVLETHTCQFFRTVGEKYLEPDLSFGCGVLNNLVSDYNHG